MCTSERHDAQKEDPAELAANFIAHAEPWHIGGETLRLYTCKRCHSTVAIPASYEARP